MLLSDPVVAAVTVQECGEEMVDLRQRPELLVDDGKQDGEGAWARVRAGVAQRLLAAQDALPEGVRFSVVEGYRPAALQQRYVDLHRSRLARACPHWSEEHLDVEASRYVSPVAVAPHPCGAAVDLTLWADGRELDLGTAVNAAPHTCANACFTAATTITAQAKHWRAVMGTALTGAGMVNYPTEWWHWSYGDRYWAVTTGASAARYAPR